jgi:hypothetical protein
MNEPITAAAPEPRTDDQNRQMASFGITAETKVVYRYQGYVYDRLSDAVAYAALDTDRATKRAS